MEVLKNIEELYKINTDDVEKINESIGSIGDVLEYSDLSKEEVLKGLNIFIEFFLSVENEDIQENILNTVLRVIETQDIDKGLNLEIIAKNMSKFNDECISYILSLLAFSGERKYRGIIENYLTDEILSEDAEEALIEIDFRIEASSHHL